MDALREYVISVMVAAMLCGMAVAMTKSTPGKELIRMVGGLLLTFAVIAPVMNFDFSEWTVFSSAYIQEGVHFAGEGENLAQSAMADIIKAEAEAYIVDKAAAGGVEIQAEILLSDDRIPIPKEVVLSGAISPYDRQRLAQTLESELGITKENQRWTG